MTSKSSRRPHPLPVPMSDGMAQSGADIPATSPGLGLAAKPNQCRASNKGTTPNAVAFLSCSRALATLPASTTLELTPGAAVRCIFDHERTPYSGAENQLSELQPWQSRHMELVQA